jgi:uncharacterized protein (DUF1330 family)
MISFPGRWCSADEWEDIMKTRYTVALSMIAGAALGGAAIQGLHAQAKPPVYVVGEIDVTNVDAYTKDYVPLARASIKNSGGKLLAASQKVTALEGTAPSSRVTINVFDSLEKARRGAIQPNTRRPGRPATSTRNSALLSLMAYRNNSVPLALTVCEGHASS